jgi:hypothetical protein
MTQRGRRPQRRRPPGGGQRHSELLSLCGIKIAPEAWSSIVEVGVAILFPERQP